MIGSRWIWDNRASPWWIGYLVTAVAELALTAALILLLPVYPLTDFPVPYVLTMMLVAYLFGEGPAILAFVLGFVSFVYLFPPYHGIWPLATTARDWAGLATFLLTTAIVGVATHLMRRSRDRATMLADELRDTSRHAMEALECIAECFFVLDTDWRFLNINQVAEKVAFERPAGDLLGRSYLQEYPEAIGSEFHRQCQSAMTDQRQVHFEACLRPLGRWFECHAFPRDGQLEVYLRDITDRKRAVAMLRQSEEKFRSLVESTNDWFWEVDANCVYTYASPRIRDLLGYEPDEVIGKTPFDFMPEDEAKDICDRFTAIASERKPLTLLDNTLVHRDGHLLVVETSGAPIIDDQGALLGYRGADRDVTDRMHAEAAIRETESRYRSLIEAMNEGFAETDADYVFTYVNPRFGEILGYVPEEVIGHQINEFLDEANRALVSTQIAERRKGGHTHYELEWVAKDGRKVYTLISPRPVFDSAGRFAGSFGVVTDITDRKAVEEALRESESKYRELFQNANDAIFLNEPSEPGSPGNFVDVNDVACTRLGYSREELLSKGPPDIDSPESAENIPRIMRELEKKGHSTFEVIQIAKDGHRVPVEISSHFFNLGGRNVLLSIARDITERKLAGERLRKSEERFRNLFERAGDSVFLHDLTGRFVEVNQSACDTLGYSREELLELTVADIVTDYEPASLDELWRNLMAGGPITVTATHRRKDGSTLAVEGRLSPFEYHEQQLILATVRDITDRIRAEEERRSLERHTEEQKRLFYRETLLSITDGKLEMCDEEDTAPYLSGSESAVEVNSAAQVCDARHGVEDFCRSRGLEGDRLDSFMIGVGEAITNAVKHGTSGTVSAGARGDVIYVGIEDNGPGIESLILPRATLLRGFSTKTSLGLGYCIMLDVADRVRLRTDRSGTLVILEKNLKERSEAMSLQDLPDTWDNIPG